MLQIKPGELAGLVLDDSTTIGIVDAEILLVAADALVDTTYRSWMTVNARTRTDYRGVFRLAVPASGPYILHARRIGYYSWNRKVTLTRELGYVQVIRVPAMPPLESVHP